MIVQQFGGILFQMQPLDPDDSGLAAVRSTTTSRPRPRSATCTGDLVALRESA